MAFMKAMDTPPNTKIGVNGTSVYTEESVGDYRVSLFTMLNRGLRDIYISEYVEKIYNRTVPDEMCDIFVMAFQTRDIRGGKGERELFYNFLKALYTHDKEAVRNVLHLIPEYGCWRDMWEICLKIPHLEYDIMCIVKQVFLDDLLKCDNGINNTMSLLSKWLPREKSKMYCGFAKKIAGFIFNDNSNERSRITMYRKATSKMNKALKTVEINMCNKTWSHIVPEKVPGKCLKLHTKAFLNESLKRYISGYVFRYPDDDDRIECRENFEDFIDDIKSGKKQAHGANVVMPHELVKQALSFLTSTEEMAINQGQWDSIRRNTKGVGKCVPMCDFSGSMDGLPKLVSLALGILISEINHDAFKDHILTFDAEPKWASFVGMKTLKEKLDSINGLLGHGLNTDFYKACMHILDKMKAYKVPIGEEPEDLIVLTDMGFDDASNNKCSWTGTSLYTSKWCTQLELIRSEFKKAGEELYGEGNGWKAPRIVVWNLRAEYNDFHETATQEGVVQLSGWSPSILRALQTTGIKVSTPYSGMRYILDNVRYDAVRSAWKAAQPTNQIPTIRA